MPTIRLDAEVYDALKKLAEPFVDTPSSVIRRLLEEHGHLAASKPAAESVPAGQALYEEFLLKVLAENFNGRGDKQKVTLAVVERMMKQRLISADDLEFVSTGETRAEACARSVQAVMASSMRPAWTRFSQ